MCDRLKNTRNDNQHKKIKTFSTVHVSGFAATQPRISEENGSMDVSGFHFSSTGINTIDTGIDPPLTCTATHEQSSYERAAAKIETATTEALSYVLHE